MDGGRDWSWARWAAADLPSWLQFVLAVLAVLYAYLALRPSTYIEILDEHWLVDFDAQSRLTVTGWVTSVSPASRIFGVLHIYVLRDGAPIWHGGVPLVETGRALTVRDTDWFKWQLDGMRGLQKEDGLYMRGYFRLSDGRTRKRFRTYITIGAPVPDPVH